MMTAIGIDAEAMPESGLLEPKDGGNKSRRASHSNNTGFGKQMYILEQEAGLVIERFLDDGKARPRGVLRVREPSP